VGNFVVLLQRVGLHWNMLAVARMSSASSGSLALALVEKLTVAAVQRGLVALLVGLDRLVQREVSPLDLGRRWVGHTVGCLAALSVSRVSGAGLVVVAAVVAVGTLQQGVLVAAGRAAVLVVGIGSTVATRQLPGPGGY
jgi:hypothetical protein